MVFTGHDDTKSIQDGASQQGEQTPAPVNQSLSEDAALADFAALLKVPTEIVEAFATAMDASSDMPLELFAFVDEKDANQAIANMVIKDEPAGMMHRAHASRLHRRAKTAAVESGLPIPGIIAPPPKAAAAKVMKEPSVPKVTLKISNFLDQSSEASFTLLNPAELRTFTIRGLRGIRAVQ